MASLARRAGATGTATAADAPGAAADQREGSDLRSADAVGRARLVGAPAPGDGLTLLERAGVPEVWRRSVSECLALIDFLDARIAPLEAELGPFAKADPRAALLDTIPGVAELLALTIAVEIGEISRFASPEKLVSYGRLA